MRVGLHLFKDRTKGLGGWGSLVLRPHTLDSTRIRVSCGGLS